MRPLISQKAKARFGVLVLMMSLGLCSPSNAEQPGVSKSHLAIGSILDLSGPLAPLGKAAHNGMQMRVNEVNDAGGIHGRSVKLHIEDSGYDPARGLVAAQKLVTQEKIFAMVGTMGTEVAEASFPALLESDVVHVFPMAASQRMYDPLHRLKFSIATPYEDQVRAGVKWLAKERGAKKFCTLYQDDDFGEEVLKGTLLGLKELELPLVAKASFKRGTTDFSAHVKTLQEAECDAVVLGTIVRETIGVVGSARKAGWNPLFLGSAATYSDSVHKLGGRTMEGLYATYVVAVVPYTDDPSKPVRDWAWRYKAKFNEDPSLISAYGYSVVDLFCQVAEKAGPNLTTEAFVKTIESMKFTQDIFGSPAYEFSAKQHLGSRNVRIGQIKNGRWKRVTDYLKL